MSEYTEHRAVCQYLKIQYPNVVFTSDASGLPMSMGLAMKIKNLKSSRGIPDLLIFEPKGGYHGLLIEMKATGTSIYKATGDLRKNPHLQEQSELMLRLFAKGYYTKFAIGSNEAMTIIDNYMRL